MMGEEVGGSPGSARPAYQDFCRKSFPVSGI